MINDRRSPRELAEYFFHRVFGLRAGFVIFLITLTAFSYFFHRYGFWGVNSRLALTYAVVEEGALRIDSYVDHPHYSTHDRALYGGHYYSDKIIGLSMLGVPVYWVLKNATDLVGKDPKPIISRYVLTVTIVSLSAALLSVVMLRFLLLLGCDLRTASAVVLFGSFGTMLFPFSCLFYPYLPSLFFLMTAFYLIVKSRTDQSGQSGGAVFGIGFLVGLALLCEYTIAVPGVLVSLYYFAAMRRRLSFFWYALGAALPLSVFAFYNWACFGDPFSLPYSHLESQEFKEGMSQGLMGVQRFQWYVLYLITLHPYRGIFVYSPFLLLGVVGIVRGLMKPGVVGRAFPVLLLATVVYFLFLNASYYMWWGGGTLLARHLTPMIPYLLLGFAWLPKRLTSLLFVLGAISVILMFPQSVVDPHFEAFYSNAELYDPLATVRDLGQGLTAPFLRHSLPEFLAGRISMNPFNHSTVPVDGKWWTLLPLLVVETGLLLWLRKTVRQTSS